MKKFFVITALICLIFSMPSLGSKLETFTALTGTDPDAGAPKSLTGSYVSFDPSEGGAECYMAGVAADFVFYAESYSPDWEYVYELWLSFPEGWVVNSVTSSGESCDNGSWGTLAATVQDPANVVQIYHPRYQGSGGCTCYCWYTVNATPGPAIGDANVSWYWDGDGYGATPHWPCSSDGYTPPGYDTCDEMVEPPAVIPPCTVEPGVYLFPSTQDNIDCPNTPVDYTLGVLNQTGANATISFSYSVGTGNGTLTGPADIYLTDTEMQDIVVTLTSDPGLSAGEIVTGTITASNNGYNDTADVNLEITMGGWVNIATEPNSGRMDNAVVTYNDMIWSIAGYGSEFSVRYYNPGDDTWTSVPESTFLNCYARSGASYQNKAFIYGDAATTGFTGLWSYNMDTNTWTNETPSGTAPAQTGIWAPAWVADPDTGYLYITGGASAPGGGNLTTVYVYDPAGNAWLDPLPNFTTERDFHAAFIYTDPYSGHKMLAIAGGVTSASVYLASTQCYDFTTGAWNPENLDIPDIPMALFGMGYAHNVYGGASQLWIIGGADSSGALFGGSYYYDVASGTWMDGGVYHASPVFRTAAASVNGVVYKIAGSLGGFSPTGLSSKYELCAEPGPDASVSASDIWWDPSAPMPGDAVTIYATVYNLGDEDITSFHIAYYYSLEPGVDLQLIQEETVPMVIPPGGSTSGSFTWFTTADMDPRMYIITVELTEILPFDTNPDNNIAFVELPLPVVLGYFTATGMGNRADIKWMTVSETDNLGFNLYRLQLGKVSPMVSHIPVKLNDSLIPGQGNSSSQSFYEYTDHVKNGGNYMYILEAVSTEAIVTDEYKTRLQWVF